MSAATTGGMWCSASTSGCSRKSETRADGHFSSSVGVSGPAWAGASPGSAAGAAWADLVALDHLVQRRRLDVQQLRRALLHAAGGFERRFDQPLLEIGDDVL